MENLILLIDYIDKKTKPFLSSIEDIVYKWGMKAVKEGIKAGFNKE